MPSKFCWQECTPGPFFFCYEEWYAAMDAAAWPGSDTEPYFRVEEIVDRARGGESETVPFNWSQAFVQHSLRTGLPGQQPAWY